MLDRSYCHLMDVSGTLVLHRVQEMKGLGLSLRHLAIIG